MKPLSELNGMTPELQEKLKGMGLEDSHALLKKLRSGADLSSVATPQQLMLWRMELERVKPSLKPEEQRALRLRGQLQQNRPEFHRSEYFKARRLGEKWRKPRGKQSKMRLCAYYRPPLVSIGYGSPAASRHLHPSGFREVLVHNPSEVEHIDAKVMAVRIAHAVGRRKREQIIQNCDRLGIKVLNR